MSNLDTNNRMAAVQNKHPGHFNDPDALQVGNIGLSLEEQQDHEDRLDVVRSKLERLMDL